MGLYKLPWHTCQHYRTFVTIILYTAHIVKLYNEIHRVDPCISIGLDYTVTWTVSQVSTPEEDGTGSTSHVHVNRRKHVTNDLRWK